VTQAPSTDQEHGDENADQIHRGVIGSGIHGLQAPPQPRHEVELAEITPQEFQAGVRRQTS